MYIILLLVITLAILFIKQRYNYWKVRGVPYLDPAFPTGNVRGLGTRLNLAEVLHSCYERLKDRGGPFGGIFFFLGPQVVATDLDFVKTILVRDFQYFHDRSLFYNERDDPLSAHLFTIEGSRWRALRAKLTPTFTSGKMKLMFPIVRDVAGELEKCLGQELAMDSNVEMKDILARFTTDVIGNCAFGLECNSLKNPGAEFREMGRRVSTLPPFTMVKFFLAQQIKPEARALGVTIMERDVTDFFMSTVKDVVEYREKSKVQRDDFMNLLIELKNSAKDSERLTLNEIAAQVFLFFFAGFDTSSTLMLFCLYELALNQDVQDKARQNVLEVLKHHGALSYDAVFDMKYLDKCISETLRMYPPAAVIFRTATKDYPGFTVTLELYPDPMKFDPERFNPDQVAKRHPFAYLPFGEGPRLCIGMRFAQMQTRVGLATLLQNFRFTVSPRTPIPPKIVPSSGLFVPQDNFWLNIERIE
ncbi:cytochrome P450 [Culex quinquefasciatus]|uniref:Cytochrome P450 n=1 Tax=Culex quinquefasciatus TaxID=7176 RepID=B0XCA7_CULQU|nr:cytochrome P450 [Culex quinquefasciatus]|eukprot:XP_001867279.1 cytochrome P450 [Culex quinquefasciatus]